MHYGEICVTEGPLLGDRVRRGKKGLTLNLWSEEAVDAENSYDFRIGNTASVNLLE